MTRTEIDDALTTNPSTDMTAKFSMQLPTEIPLTVTFDAAVSPEAQDTFVTFVLQISVFEDEMDTERVPEEALVGVKIRDVGSDSPLATIIWVVDILITPLEYTLIAAVDGVAPLKRMSCVEFKGMTEIVHVPAEIALIEIPTGSTE
jgi:hypothetical protein